jgi:septal ring-binding cell division protein DamX
LGEKIKVKKILIAVLALILLTAGAAWAVTDTNTLSIGATVTNQATLSINGTKTPSITFADSNPDTVASIPSVPASLPVIATAKTGSASLVTLKVVALGDLTSTVPTPETIPIGAVTWTASGTGFTPGTMNKTTAQTCGSWTGSGKYTGSFSYFLANSWTLPVGAFTQTATYTLTAP